MQHKPHALNMTIPPTPARGGETERWSKRGRKEEAERRREQHAPVTLQMSQTCTNQYKVEHWLSYFRYLWLYKVINKVIK